MFNCAGRMALIDLNNYHTHMARVELERRELKWEGEFLSFYILLFENYL